MESIKEATDMTVICQCVECGLASPVSTDCELFGCPGCGRIGITARDDTGLRPDGYVDLERRATFLNAYMEAHGLRGAFSMPTLVTP